MCGQRLRELADAIRSQGISWIGRPASFRRDRRRAVSLAKALLNHPEILLLDEPTASLDPDTADWVRAELERYRAERGATILLASHNMGEVERLCDRVIMMKRGEIVDDGSPGKLLTRYDREKRSKMCSSISHAVAGRRRI